MNVRTLKFLVTVSACRFQSSGRRAGIVLGVRHAWLCAAWGCNPVPALLLHCTLASLVLKMCFQAGKRLWSFFFKIILAL